MGKNPKAIVKLGLLWVAGIVLVHTPLAWAQTSTGTSTAKKPVHRAAASPGKSTKRKPAATAHHAAILPTPETRRLTSAFTASAELRPMAQQLVSTRNAAAYAGVTSYAASHSGEASAAGYLALGHAYSLDHRYTDAETSFRTAGARGQVLGDYADFLAAQAAEAAGKPQDAVTLLEHFADKYPGSLFVPNVPLLQTQAYLDLHDPANALRVLTPLQNTPAASHSDFRLALGKAYQAAGNAALALALYRQIYIGDPLSPEAVTAKNQLAAMNAPLAPAERKQHADAMFNAKQYSVAEDEYRALQKNEKQLSQADRDALEIYIAVCELRLKKISRMDVARLPVTGDDSAALKLYMESELAREGGSTGEHDQIVQGMLKDYPKSRWLEEALYSGGNMYLIKKDDSRAISEYLDLTSHFPHSTYAPSAHWHAAWLNYRLRQYPEAARLMDEQIVNYPAGVEVPGALYWRARLYEDVEHNLPQALNYYRALNAAYANSYYSILARQRIAVIGTRDAVPPAPVLASVHPVDDPHLTAALPENDPHLIKARLLANAGLNEYIKPEIHLSATANGWGTLAEAEIYQSFGCSVAHYHSHVELHSVAEVQRVACAAHAVLHGVEVSKLAGIAHHALHHGLGSLLIQQAPNGTNVDHGHFVHHVAILQKVRRQAVARIQRISQSLAIAKDHRGLVQERYAHARRTHGPNRRIADHDRLDLLLGKICQDGLVLKLPLSNANNASACSDTECRKSQGFAVLIHLQAAGRQGVLQPLQLRRKYTVLQLHGCRRVLHRLVVNHDNLLNILGDGRACVTTQLRSLSCLRSHCYQRCRDHHRKHRSKLQIFPGIH